LATRILVAVSLTSVLGVSNDSRAAVPGCDDYPSFGNISGSRDTAVLSGGNASACTLSKEAPVQWTPQAYYTHEIACSADRVQALDGLCSATPCSLAGQYFAFRTIHYPDGREEPAGFQCVSLDQATATPGVSAADVFAAVRRVRLPGGRIQITPGARGLANLPSFFWLQGADQPPVDLPLQGAMVHAEFGVVEYRWAFGDGQTETTTTPGGPGQHSPVQVAYRQRGHYRIGVQVVWVATAWLDGRRVGQVDGLASQAAVTYPVAELKTILTG
jgi:hypothetical protein